MSSWCQGFLELPDSELNSLWYERLAAAASSQDCKPLVTVSLYQLAIEEKNPSWLCYRGLGTTYYSQGRTREAINQVEQALKEAQRENATPTPEAKDIIGLHLLLGQYAYDIKDVHSAEEHYSIACKSEDVAQAKQGRLGRLKARLSSPDAEETRQFLKTTLAQENGEEEMVGILKMIARDTQHDILMPKLFKVAKGDPDLMRQVVGIIQTATAIPAPGEGRNAEILEGDDRFEEDEARGVLLYDQGFAAYKYKVASDDADPINEALRLWRESRDQLANVGGSNAFLIRQRATTALAIHYFQNIMDRLKLDHYDELEKLTKLANSEPDSNVYLSDSVGFLGTIYASSGKKELARPVLVQRIKQGLQILSDDILENDKLGFSSIQKALEQYQDFTNAAVALSLLGQPDLVTDTLYFEASDITETDGEEKQRVLDMVIKLAKETIQIAKTQVPDVTKQVQRIGVAKAHIDSLVAAVEAKTGASVNGNSNGNSNEDVKDTADPVTTQAHRLLQSRLSELQQKHTPEIDPRSLPWCWTCDGRTPDGAECGNDANFDREFYHCVYCTNKDFCGDCLAELRNPKSTVEIAECSANHKWLHIPPQGADIYVGQRAKSVRVPVDVRPLNEDKQILRIYYAEDGGGEEITVEAWKERLTKEWDISLEEIRNGISRQATPENGEESEKIEVAN